MSSLYVLLVVVAAASAFSVLYPNHHNQVAEWNMFKKNYRIQYNDTAEDERHMEIYFMNKNIVANHNRRYELGQESFKLRINQFSSMTLQEYLQIANGFKIPNSNELYINNTDTIKNI